MVDDLIDLAGGMVGDETLIASKTEEKKEKKKKGYPSIIILVSLLLIAVFFVRWVLVYKGNGGMAKLVFDEWSYIGLVGLISATLVVLLFFGIAIYFKNKDIKLKKIYIFLFISALLTGIGIWAVFPENLTLLQLIPLTAFIFGISLMFLLLYDKLGDITVNKIIQFPVQLIIKVLILLMPFWIIFLGAMQGGYGYESVFLQEAQQGIDKFAGGILGDTIYRIIEILFTMGSNRPGLFLFICFAAFLVLIYNTIRSHFFKENFPYPTEYLSKEDLEAFKKEKLRLKKKYLNTKKDSKGGSKTKKDEK